MKNKGKATLALAAALAALTLSGCMSIKSAYMPQELGRSRGDQASAVQYGSFYDGSYKEYTGTIITEVDGNKPEGSNWSLGVEAYNLFLEPGSHEISGVKKAWQRDMVAKTAMVYTTAFKIACDLAPGRAYEVVDVRETGGEAMIKNADIVVVIDDHLALISRPNIMVVPQESGGYKLASKKK
jgi:hypothetical protein